MITKITLGNGSTVTDISDIQETVQDMGEYIQRALTVNIGVNSEGTAADINVIEAAFTVVNALSSIQVYKRDEVSINDQGVATYGDEYLSTTIAGYIKVRSIYKHFSSGLVAVTLIK
jgi:hypothetical protein